MSLPPLTIIPAGAGSGKTHTIQTRLSQWVRDGEVAAGRIAAVTFTESAAAELRERIGAGLLAMGRVDEALELDEAYISTIHGFGLRILTEFAFDGGFSPAPRLLNEDEQNALIRQSLAGTDATDAITADLAAYGYQWSYGGLTAEGSFRKDVLAVVDLLRSVAGEQLPVAYSGRASDWIERRYGQTFSATTLEQELCSRVRGLLEQFPHSLASEYGKSAAARTDFERDFTNLHRASNPAIVAREWRLWQALRGMRQSKRGAALPEAYDALAQGVIDAAGRLAVHPGPRDQACAQVDALLKAGWTVLKHYGRAKREAGLVDYTDMVSMAGQLLRERPKVLKTLAGRIDCLVVDEFQDTNPLQFSLLWQLHQAGVPTVVVGDLKQAIMGFQGADPRLFDALEKQHPENSIPQTKNWRSSPGIMQFVNTLGGRLFGADYVSLDPQRGQDEIAPLEALVCERGVRRGQHAVRATALGRRFAALLDGNERIADRHSRKLRPLKGSDLAVLCPTRNVLNQYARVFRALGLQVRLDADGWFQSREVQLACQALTYLANPSDRHAALYLAVTELGDSTLEEGLIVLMDGGRISDAVLGRLDALASGVTDRTVYALVADTLDVLDLFGLVARWPDGEQARANLLRLLAMSGEFMDANREALANGGYHGAGVQTFLAWLNARVGERDGDRQPEPRVIDEDAIDLVTWHSAKGREWPVVAVCELERKLEVTLPQLDLAYDDFGDLSRLLEAAWVRYSPAFAAPETRDRFSDVLWDAQEQVARRLLYVALTRARDKLIIEWPAYKQGKAGGLIFGILTDRCALELQGESFVLDDHRFNCAVTHASEENVLDDEVGAGAGASAGEGAGESAGASAGEGASHGAMDDERARIGRLAISRGLPPPTLTPDSVAPSSLRGPESGPDAKPVQTVPYGSNLSFREDLPPTLLGTFVHRCFEVSPANLEALQRLARAEGLDLRPEELTGLRQAVTDFDQWLSGFAGGHPPLREWPVLARDANQSVMAGIVDLVVRTPAGLWVIDHKSDRIDDPAGAFEHYRLQLDAYAQALDGPDHRVIGVGINWVRQGVVCMQPGREA